MRARSEPGRAVYAELGDTLMAIKMQLESAIQAEARLIARDEQAHRRSARADRASLSIRQISAELGSVLLDTLGMAATIEWYLHQFQKCTAIHCELCIDDGLRAGLAEEYATAIFEVFHEALSNVAHHSRARKIAITVSITPLQVALVVRDDGIGIAETQARDANFGGLAKIRECANSHRGRCSIVGAPDRGTTLSVSLPLTGTGGHRWETTAMRQ